MNDKPNLCRTSPGNVKSGKCSAVDCAKPLTYISIEDGSSECNSDLIVIVDCQYFIHGKRSDRCKWFYEEARAFRLCKCEEAIVSSTIVREIDRL